MSDDLLCAQDCVAQSSRRTLQYDLDGVRGPGRWRGAGEEGEEGVEEGQLVGRVRGVTGWEG